MKNLPKAHTASATGPHLLACVIALAFTFAAGAANVRLYFRNPDGGELDTNSFLVRAIGSNVLSSGGVVTRGVPIRVTPSADGLATNNLALGHYSVSNAYLGQGIVIRVPDDATSAVYDYTNLLISGYNTYVTIGGDGTAGAITNNEARAVSLSSNLVVAGTITGDGSPVTNLNAASLASGTIPDARLSVVLQSLATNNASTLSNLNARPVYNVKALGAYGDTKKVTDAVLTSGTNLVTSASAGFTADDVGKECFGTYPEGAGNWLAQGTITQVVSSSAVLVSTYAAGTRSPANFLWGHNDTEAIRVVGTNANTFPRGTVHFPPGGYMIDKCLFYLVYGASSDTIAITGDNAEIYPSEDYDFSTIPATGGMVWYSANDNAMYISGITIDGSWLSQGNNRAISVLGHSTLLENVKVENFTANFAPGITIDGSHCTLKNVIVNYCYEGIRVHYGPTFMLRGSTSNCTRYGLYCVGLNGATNNEAVSLTVMEALFDECALGSIYLDNSTDVMFFGSVVFAGGWDAVYGNYGVQLTNSSSASFIGCKLIPYTTIGDRHSLRVNTNSAAYISDTRIAAAGAGLAVTNAGTIYDGGNNLVSSGNVTGNAWLSTFRGGVYSTNGFTAVAGQFTGNGGGLTNLAGAQTNILGSFSNSFSIGTIHSSNVFQIKTTNATLAVEVNTNGSVYFAGPIYANGSGSTLADVFIAPDANAIWSFSRAVDDLLLADGVSGKEFRFGANGTLTALTFAGVGTALTGLNPTNINSGYSAGHSIGGNAATATTATTAVDANKWQGLSITSSITAGKMPRITSSGTVELIDTPAGGDVTQAGQNNFTGTNSFASNTTFNAEVHFGDGDEIWHLGSVFLKPQQRQAFGSNDVLSVDFHRRELVDGTGNAILNWSNGTVQITGGGLTATIFNTTDFTAENFYPGFTGRVAYANSAGRLVGTDSLFMPPTTIFGASNLTTEGHIYVAATSTTVTLPDATTNSGRFIFIHSKTNDTVSIATVASQTINREASPVIKMLNQQDAVIAGSDGTNWFLWSCQPMVNTGALSSGHFLSTDGVNRFYTNFLNGFSATTPAFADDDGSVATTEFVERSRGGTNTWGNTALTFSLGRNVFTNMAGNLTIASVTGFGSDNRVHEQYIRFNPNGGDRVLTVPADWWVSGFTNATTVTITNGTMAWACVTCTRGVETNITISFFQ